MQRKGEELSTRLRWGRSGGRRRHRRRHRDLELWERWSPVGSGDLLKVRPRRGKEWAWRPGRMNRASCSCNRLAQRPQGRLQEKSLLVSTSHEDIQTSRPAKGQRTWDRPTDAPSRVYRQRDWCPCNLYLEGACRPETALCPCGFTLNQINRAV